MSATDELILASRALAHAAHTAISLEHVPSRIIHDFYDAVRAQEEQAKRGVPTFAEPATQRAIIEVPNNVNQAQVLVTRMFESLQADVARLEAKDEERWTMIGQHELAMQSVETRMSALEREMLHQFEVLAIKVIEYGDRQQLIMQKLESLRAEVACKCVVIAKFRGGYAQDPSKCPVHGYPAQENARKRQPKPVRRKGRK